MAGKVPFTGQQTIFCFCEHVPNCRFGALCPMKNLWPMKGKFRSFMSCAFPEWVDNVHNSHHQAGKVQGDPTPLLMKSRGRFRDAQKNMFRQVSELGSSPQSHCVSSQGICRNHFCFLVFWKMSFDHLWWFQKKTMAWVFQWNFAWLVEMICVLACSFGITLPFELLPVMQDTQEMKKRFQNSHAKHLLQQLIWQKQQEFLVTQPGRGVPISALQNSMIFLMAGSAFGFVWLGNKTAKQVWTRSLMSKKQKWNFKSGWSDNEAAWKHFVLMDASIKFVTVTVTGGFLHGVKHSWVQHNGNLRSWGASCCTRKASAPFSLPF